jgi:GTP cyclohydrolase I
MIQRGVQQHESTTLTTARRGLFLDNPELEVITPLPKGRGF